LCGAAEERAGFVRLVERLILATDMSRHAEFSAALRSDIDRARALPPAGPPATAVGEEERRLLLELLIKAADTSNVLRPFPVAKRWAVRITQTHAACSHAPARASTHGGASARADARTRIRTEPPTAFLSRSSSSVHARSFPTVNVARDVSFGETSPAAVSPSLAAAVPVAATAPA
jgi:hypothetical protein